jgi:hypothetical protein
MMKRGVCQYRVQRIRTHSRLERRNNCGVDFLMFMQAGGEHHAALLVMKCGVGTDHAFSCSFETVVETYWWSGVRVHERM